MDLETLAELAPWDWPKNTGQVLLDALRDDGLNPSDRMIAVELAGNFVVVNDEIFAELLTIIAGSQESESLRGRAAIALGPALAHGWMDGFEDPEDVPISEQCFLEAQEALHKVFLQTEHSKEVRRRVLEASVRAPQDWHQGAIRDAYASNDEDWQLTAVFAMGHVQGFDDQILEALGSDNEDIEYEAVCSAGTWGLKAAWKHVAGIVASGKADKELLLAAIEAVAVIRPKEAGVVLLDLTNDNDEDIVEAAYEAMAMAEGPLMEDIEDEDDGVLLF